MSDFNADSFVEEIPVEVAIELGRRRMVIRELATLSPEDVIELDQTVDAPVNLVVGDRVVARGELVVVGHRMALRITEVPGRATSARKAG